MELYRCTNSYYVHTSKSNRGTSALFGPIANVNRVDCTDVFFCHHIVFSTTYVLKTNKKKGKGNTTYLLYIYMFFTVRRVQSNDRYFFAENTHTFPINMMQCSLKKPSSF